MNFTMCTSPANPSYLFWQLHWPISSRIFASKSEFNKPHEILKSKHFLGHICWFNNKFISWYRKNKLCAKVELTTFNVELCFKNIFWKYYLLYLRPTSSSSPTTCIYALSLSNIYHMTHDFCTRALVMSIRWGISE